MGECPVLQYKNFTWFVWQKRAGLWDLKEHQTHLWHDNSQGYDNSEVEGGQEHGGVWGQDHRLVYYLALVYETTPYAYICVICYFLVCQACPLWVTSIETWHSTLSKPTGGVLWQEGTMVSSLPMNLWVLSHLSNKYGSVDKGSHNIIVSNTELNSKQPIILQ